MTLVEGDVSHLGAAARRRRLGGLQLGIRARGGRRAPVHARADGGGGVRGGASAHHVRVRHAAPLLHRTTAARARRGERARPRGAGRPPARLERRTPCHP